MALLSLLSARFQFRLWIVIYLLIVPVQFYFSTREIAVPLLSVSEDHSILNFTKSPYDELTRQTIRVAGASPLNLLRYANSRRVTVTVSGATGKRFQGKVEICSHRYPSTNSCQCEKGECRSPQKGEWSEEWSPYGNRFIDALFERDASGIVTVSLEEDLQGWRLVWLLMVFILHLCAPLVSSWAPLYYTSSMTMGVLLVVLFGLFQGMKLISGGRKGFIYIALGSLGTAAMFTVHFFSRLVDSILVNFGIVADAHFSILVSVLVLTALPGASLGYWVVQRYIVSEDGSVNTGVAKTVRWTMRFIAIVFVSMSTLEPPLGWVAWITSWFICSLITSRNWRTRAIQHPTNTDVMNTDVMSEVPRHPTNTDVMSEVSNVALTGSPRENRRASNVTSPGSLSRNGRHLTSPASPSKNGHPVTSPNGLHLNSPASLSPNGHHVASPEGSSRNGRHLTSPNGRHVTSPAGPSRNRRHLTSPNERHVASPASTYRNGCHVIKKRWSR